jgi:hypothetical protein
MCCRPDDARALEILRREFPHWGILVLGHGPGSWVGIRGKNMTIYAADPGEIRAKLLADQARRQRPSVRCLGPALEPAARQRKYLYPSCLFWEPTEDVAAGRRGHRGRIWSVGRGRGRTGQVLGGAQRPPRKGTAVRSSVSSIPPDGSPSPCLAHPVR